MLKIKIFIISLVLIFFNGCARHHVSPVDVAVTGLVGTIILNPFYGIRSGYYYGHHRGYYHGYHRGYCYRNYRRPYYRH